MSKYFSYFPKTVYSLNSSDVDAVTNIVSRFGFEQSFKNNSAVYYEYNVQDSDTPEIIANKFYGSSERHWAVLMINDIVDPQFDWPLDQRTIISFIDEKYSANANIGQSGIAWAQSNVKAYYKIETRTTISTDTELKTKLEIDTTKTLLELSKGPLDAYASQLAASATSATNLANELERALKATLAMQNKTGVGGGAGKLITDPGKYDKIQENLTKELVSMGIDAGPAAGLAASSARLQAQADAYFRANPNIDPLTGAQRRMYGGAIMSKGKGGMGIVKAMAFGGRAIGSDTVPAMLTPGEFVMNKGASKAYGPLLERINESKYPGMLGGGGMTQIPVNNISTSMNDNSTAVYNYNLGFSINGANGSAKDIANAVMREIKNVDSQRIRGQRR